MASRRTISTQKMAQRSGEYRSARGRSNKMLTSANGGVAIDPAQQKLNTINRQLTLRGYKRRQRRNQPAKETSLDLLHVAGISLAQDNNRTSRDFSLVKTQTANTVVRNPMILDPTTYVKLPKNPILTNTVFKDPTNSFYTADPPVTFNEQKRRTRKMQLQQPDTTDMAMRIIARGGGVRGLGAAIGRNK